MVMVFSVSSQPPFSYSHPTDAHSGNEEIAQAPSAPSSCESSYSDDSEKEDWQRHTASSSQSPSKTPIFSIAQKNTSVDAHPPYQEYLSSRTIPPSYQNKRREVPHSCFCQIPTYDSTLEPYEANTNASKPSTHIPGQQVQVAVSSSKPQRKNLGELRININSADSIHINVESKVPPRQEPVDIAPKQTFTDSRDNHSAALLLKQTDTPTNFPECIQELGESFQKIKNEINNDLNREHFIPPLTTPTWLQTIYAAASSFLRDSTATLAAKGAGELISTIVSDYIPSLASTFNNMGLGLGGILGSVSACSSALMIFPVAKGYSYFLASRHLKHETACIVAYVAATFISIAITSGPLVIAWSTLSVPYIGAALLHVPHYLFMSVIREAMQRTLKKCGPTITAPKEHKKTAIALAALNYGAANYCVNLLIPDTGIGSRLASAAIVEGWDALGATVIKTFSYFGGTYIGHQKLVQRPWNIEEIKNEETNEIIQKRDETFFMSTFSRFSAASMVSLIKDLTNLGRKHSKNNIEDLTTKIVIEYILRLVESIAVAATEPRGTIVHCAHKGETIIKAYSTINFPKSNIKEGNYMHGNLELKVTPREVTIIDHNSVPAAGTPNSITLARPPSTHSFAAAISPKSPVSPTSKSATTPLPKILEVEDERTSSAAATPLNLRKAPHTESHSSRSRTAAFFPATQQNTASEIRLSVAQLQKAEKTRKGLLKQQGVSSKNKSKNIDIWHDAPSEFPVNTQNTTTNGKSTKISAPPPIKTQNTAKTNRRKVKYHDTQQYLSNNPRRPIATLDNAAIQAAKYLPLDQQGLITADGSDCTRL